MSDVSASATRKEKRRWKMMMKNERIKFIVTGEGESVQSGRQNPLEIDVDNKMLKPIREPPVALQTPPSTLTVREHHMPSPGEDLYVKMVDELGGNNDAK
ncbi:unnamed protein product [Soboliphyme baturini]|uniref:Uncharacterized protein n=1 Tax=Soboliphyme baturini TaxID=241478 RepID=A0A183IA93_9BILA|nr:unnamed protein product [Soboliphyme baturini]